MSDGQLAQAVVTLSFEDRQMLAGLDATTRKIAGELAKTTKIAQDGADKVARAYTLSFTNIQAGFQMASAAMRPLIDFTKESIGAYAQQEKAEATLTAALKARGQYTEAVAKAAIDNADSLQNLTNVSDDALLTVAGLVESLTGLSGSAMPDAQRAAVQLSKVMKGGDGSVEGAASLMTKAINGNMTMLKRYGIDVEDTGSKLGNLQAILRATAAGWDIAIAQANTTAGQLERVKVQYSEVQEAFGKGLVGGTGESFLKGVADELHEIATNGTAENLGKAASAMVDALPTLTAGFAKIAEALAWISGDKVKRWAAGMGAYTQAYFDGSDQMAAFRQGQADYDYGLAHPKGGGGYQFQGPLQPTAGAGAASSDATASGIAAEAARINQLFALYAKGGEFAKQALAIDPDILAHWKAIAGDIEVAGFEAGKLTEANKTLAEEAKKAADAEAKYIAEIEKNYQSTIDQYNNSTAAFREWFDTFDPSMKQVALDWQTAGMSAGEAYQVMYEVEQGFDRTAQTFKDIPVWAVEAWDSASEAGKEYLEFTYGMNDDIAQSYVDAFATAEEAGTRFFETIKAGQESMKELAEDYAQVLLEQVKGQGQVLDIIGQQLQVQLSMTDDEGERERLKGLIKEHAKKELEAQKGIVLANEAVVEAQLAQAMAQEALLSSRMAELSITAAMARSETEYQFYQAQMYQMQDAMLAAEMSQVQAQAQLAVLQENLKLLNLQVAALDYEAPKKGKPKDKEEYQPGGYGGGGSLTGFVPVSALGQLPSIGLPSVGLPSAEGNTAGATMSQQQIDSLSSLMRQLAGSSRSNPSYVHIIGSDLHGGGMNAEAWA